MIKDFPKYLVYQSNLELIQSITLIFCSVIPKIMMFSFPIQISTLGFFQFIVAYRVVYIFALASSHCQFYSASNMFLLSLCLSFLHAIFVCKINHEELRFCITLTHQNLKVLPKKLSSQNKVIAKQYIRSLKLQQSLKAVPFILILKAFYLLVKNQRLFLLKIGSEISIEFSNLQSLLLNLKQNSIGEHYYLEKLLRKHQSKIVQTYRRVHLLQLQMKMRVFCTAKNTQSKIFCKNTNELNDPLVVLIFQWKFLIYSFSQAYFLSLNWFFLEFLSQNVQMFILYLFNKKLLVINFIIFIFIISNLQFKFSVIGMIPNKSYLQQITMIESECEPKKMPNIPAAIFHRSPLRERQNKNISNAGTPNRNPKKISISPYRRRQSNSSITNPIPNQKISISKKKSHEPQCDQHVGKSAKFMIESEGQVLYYCEKCAIQLASQGFKVERISCELIKIQQSENRPLNSMSSMNAVNPRKKELDDFLRNVQSLLGQLEKKKIDMDKVMKREDSSYKEEVEKVQQYYCQFYEIIDQHKSRVLDELSQEFNNETKGIKNVMSQINNAIDESNDMKEEVIKLEEEILQAEEREYRPCMNEYISKVKNYNQLTTDSVSSDVKMKKLIFNDPDEACQMFIKCMNIQWEQQNNGQNFKSACHQKSMLSQQSTMRNDNPIEYLEKEERKQNNNMKTLGTLFSSFDE